MAPKNVTFQSTRLPGDTSCQSSGQPGREDLRSGFPDTAGSHALRSRAQAGRHTSQRPRKALPCRALEEAAPVAGKAPFNTHLTLLTRHHHQSKNLCVRKRTSEENVFVTLLWGSLQRKLKPTGRAAGKSGTSVLVRWVRGSCDPLRTLARGVPH